MEGQYKVPILSVLGFGIQLPITSELYLSAMINLTQLAAAVGAIGVIGGGAITLDTRHVAATDFEQYIEQRWGFEKDTNRQEFFDQYQEDTPAK